MGGKESRGEGVPFSVLTYAFWSWMDGRLTAGRGGRCGDQMHIRLSVRWYTGSSLDEFIGVWG